MSRRRIDGAEFTRWVRRNFDEAAVMAVAAKVAWSRDAELDATDEVILEAFRRSTPRLENADAAEIGDYLSEMGDDAIVGVVSNVKGITHEILFVETENLDGDTVFAELFEETNHPGVDAAVRDVATGEDWEVQLKAVDDPAHVQQWIDEHPDGRIAVTEELAERMGLESTGVHNGQLTADVEEFIDRAGEDETVWQYVPTLAVASISIVVWSLWRRYQKGELTRAWVSGSLP